MSGIVNPFSQFGNYQDPAFKSHDDTVTTSYLTGLPDLRQIADDQVATIFKQMMKRDSRTKTRALTDFDQWLTSLSPNDKVEDGIHLAYIQMYAKLSIDVSPQIRVASHNTLGHLYSILGKRSSKYLQYSVGPWITGLYDPDAGAANAAKEALVKIFPGDKSSLFITKFESAIREFIYDSCTNATAQTLTDERYYSKEESSQKYTRLIKCCLNVFLEYPKMFDLYDTGVCELVESGRLWRFFSSSDPSLARCALRLAQSRLADLEYCVPTIWKELLRAGRKKTGGAGVALEVIQLMNVLTSKYPKETWPEDVSVRKDALASLSQFITSEPPHPARFWPLLYNMVLNIPEPPQRDLTPLYKPLERVVLNTRHNRELEESVWGCFVSLAGKMGQLYIQQSFKAACSRCRTPSVPVASIAKFLSRVADTEGLTELVTKQIQNSPPLEYLAILSKIPEFTPLIEDLALPKLGAKEIAVLVDANEELKMPASLEITPESEWIHIAIKSHSIDTQHVVECLASFGLQREILQHARALYEAHANYSLDAFVREHVDDAEILENAVSGHGTSFVSDDTARTALKLIVRSALDDQDKVKSVLRTLRANIDFVQQAANVDTALKEGLEILAIDDTTGILDQLENLNVSSYTSGADNAGGKNIDYLEHLDIESLDLSVPFESYSNPLRAVIPKIESDGLDGAVSLVESLETALRDIEEDPTLLERSQETATKLAIINEYAKSWAAVAPAHNKLDRFIDGVHKLDIKPQVSQLWELLESKSPSVAYHAALALVASGPLNIQKENSIKFSRDLFTRPTLKGAVLAYFSAVEGEVQYDNLQRSLIREAQARRLKDTEWMLIDKSFVPESFSTEIAGGDDEKSNVEAIFAVSTFGNRVANLASLVYESADRTLEFVALSSLDNVDDLNQLLEYSANLPQETGLDVQSAKKCLQLINNYYLQEGSSAEDVDEESVQSLIESDSITKCWAGIQVLKHMEYRPTLELKHEGNLETEPQVLAAWLITLNQLGTSTVSEEDARRSVFQWVNQSLKSLGSADLSADLKTEDISALPNTAPSSPFDTVLFLNVLFHLCDSEPNAVREWYRDLRDKTTIKRVDAILSSIIIPAILKNVSQELNNETFGEEVEVSINEKQREVRASRVVEEEFTIELVISLPEQYPGKPASVDIRRLAGVSEAKKRGWLLEARQKLQTGGILVALRSVLSRLDNFLDGIEPCAICYMTVDDMNKLPNKTCAQCHSVYHTDCLYKWFSTNGNKLCPMCRAPM